jgi:hypothetical protein
VWPHDRGQDPSPFIQAMIFVYRICQLLLSAANLVNLIYDIYITDEFVTHIFIQPCNTLTHSTNEDLLNIKYAINSVILFLSSMFNRFWETEIYIPSVFRIYAYLHVVNI